ncbi:conserved hypothetical protein [Flavobacterium sp. 9AF]|uniref:hypothetical protein n=1 Tax=Flavobacterium sp. 9AF TaxID=2653142 RepID=UPI0012F448A7|nr:hypothetical protein [Flavobacterium sp. 9AF]VXC43108.1 conserved hypothetical protein [Flavobacterium sp. 9AF]
MNKIIAIFLITIFLCANTSIGQLLKVPNLLEHYKEHQKNVATSSISFVQFLKLHYSKNFENNQEEHQNLPFKTFDNVTSVLFVISFINLQIQLIKPLITCKQKFFYNKSFKSKLVITIWMPPKIA